MVLRPAILNLGRPGASLDKIIDVLPPKKTFATRSDHGQNAFLGPRSDGIDGHSEDLCGFFRIQQFDHKDLLFLA
jgi:hypothetical protein